jgi:hypothetical protein
MLHTQPLLFKSLRKKYAGLIGKYNERKTNLKRFIQCDLQYYLSRRRLPAVETLRAMTDMQLGSEL